MSVASLDLPSVAAEVANGDVLPLTIICREQRISPSAGTRWILDGLPGPLGIQRVRLAALKRGKRWITSHAALARFFAAIQADAPLPPMNVRTPAKREQAAARAEAELAGRYGI